MSLWSQIFLGYSFHKDFNLTFSRETRFLEIIKEIRGRKWKIVALRSKNGDKKVAPFIKEETKRKLSPFVFAVRRDKSLLQTCPAHRILLCISKRAEVVFLKLYFFSTPEFHFFASAVVFLQQNDQISPITQSAQRGALETFILCTLYNSVQLEGFQRGQYVNMEREQGNT